MKRLLFFLVLSILLCAQSQHFGGKTVLGGYTNARFTNSYFYLATTGNDHTNCGSITDPCATIDYMIPRVPDNGSTIIVRDGTYTGIFKVSNRKFTNWLTIRAEHRYQALIRNSGNFALAIFNAGHVILQGFDVARTDPGSTDPLLAHIFQASDHIILIDNMLHDSQNNDVMKINEGSTPILLTRNLFWNQFSGAGQLIDANGTHDTFMVNNMYFENYTGALPADSNHFVIVKDSDLTQNSRRNWVIGEVMLNWEQRNGSAFVGAGEDGLAWYETQDMHIQNCLMIRNSIYTQRSATNFKGVKGIAYTNNTIVGSGPTHEMAFRANDEGANPPNMDIAFNNNIWSVTAPNSQVAFDSSANTQNQNFTLFHNVAWNYGQPLPTGCGDGGCTNIVEFSSDPAGIITDPGFASQAGIQLPIWNGTSFPSGETDIWSEAKRIALAYGTPTNATIYGTADKDTAPYEDLLFRPRGSSPDPGAIQHDAVNHSMSVIAVQRAIGNSAYNLNVVAFDQPVSESDGRIVSLVSSNPSLLQVPSYVYVQQGALIAPFSITLGDVGSNTPVFIYAYYLPRGSSPITAVSRTIITPQSLTINLNPYSMPSGRAFGLSVSLAGPAPPAGTVVSLSSDLPAAIQLPATVTIPGGQSVSPTISVESYPDNTTQTVNITGTAGLATGTAPLILTPAALYIDPAAGSNFYSGVFSGSKVRIPFFAPTGGTIVHLSTDNAIASVPATVTVPAGAYYQTFDITGLTTPTRVFFNVSGDIGGPSVQTLFSVLPITLYRIYAGYYTAGHNGPTSVLGYGGGALFTGAELIVNAGYTSPVVITQSPTLLTGIVSPINILPGTKITANVPSGVTCPQVTSNQSTTLTGTYNGSSTNITVTCLMPDIGSLYMNSTSVPVGTTNVILFINFPGGVTNYMTINANITSSDVTIANPPSPQTIAIGTDRVVFPVTFLRSGSVRLTATNPVTGTVKYIDIAVTL